MSKADLEEYEGKMVKDKEGFERYQNEGDVRKLKQEAREHLECNKKVLLTSGRTLAEATGAFIKWFRTAINLGKGSICAVAFHINRAGGSEQVRHCDGNQMMVNFIMALENDCQLTKVARHQGKQPEQCWHHYEVAGGKRVQAGEGCFFRGDRVHWGPGTPNSAQRFSIFVYEP